MAKGIGFPLPIKGIGLLSPLISQFSHCELSGQQVEGEKRKEERERARQLELLQNCAKHSNKQEQAP